MRKLRNELERQADRKRLSKIPFSEPVLTDVADNDQVDVLLLLTHFGYLQLRFKKDIVQAFEM